MKNRGDVKMGCGPCGTCNIIGGIVVALAGLGITGSVPVLTPMVGGWLLMLYGIVLIVHGLCLCPMCKSCDMKK
jgi:hypothetical protein